MRDASAYIKAFHQRSALMAEYHLTATWRIAAPQQRVFDAVCDSLTWPLWWPGAESVVQSAPGDAIGIGCIRQYIWKSRLPYRLVFQARTIRVEAPHQVEATVSGDVEGSGRWQFSHEDGMTTIHYEWQVRTTKPWMNLASPFMRRIFIMNHHALMKAGTVGLAKLLGAPVTDFRYGELRRMPTGRAINWIAAALAGILAGVAATGLQLALWWSAQYTVFGMLLRDSRLAAAIILGPSVLDPPSVFESKIMLVAGALHFALSVAYGLALAPFIVRTSRLRAIVTGGVFGLAVFSLNMYGFTALFPWFVVSRDWITAMAHVAFGVSCAMAFQAFSEVVGGRSPPR